MILPCSGYCAFTHKAGIHAKAILNNPSTYEILKPEDFGLKRYVSIGYVVCFLYLVFPSYVVVLRTASLHLLAFLLCPIFHHSFLIFNFDTTLRY